MAITQPLNLQEIFLVNFAGTVPIFIFLMIIFFAGLAARFRMPNGVVIPIFVLFVVLMSGIPALRGELTGLYIITVSLIAIFVYTTIASRFK